MRRSLSVLTVMTIMLALTVPAFAQTVLFGPKTYTRTAGPPNSFTDTFTLPAGTTAPYTLHVVNGNANGTNRISSATIKLNGVEILDPNDFGQNVAVLDRTVALQATNTLEIRLTSAPGSFITVSVLDTSAGTQPTALTPNPLALTVGATANLTATLAPAPTAAGSLAVSSANPAVVTVPASVAFTAGQTSVPVTVTAVASGSTTVTVTLNGASVASQVDVALPAPTVTGFTPTSGQPGTSVTVTGTNFVNVQTVTFNGVLAPTFTVTNATTLVAVVPPTATTGPIAVMTLAGTGTSAASFTVIPAPTVASLQPATLSIVRGNTGTLTVTLSAVQTSAISVTLSNSNAAVATVPGTVSVPANQLSAPVTITAIALGQADITASLNGTSASSTITVVNPVPSITTLAPASAPSGSPNQTLTVTGQQFVTGAIVQFGPTALVTTVVSATQLTAAIPAAALTTKGTVPVTVENPAPGGGVSNNLPFTIVNGAPVLAPIGNKTVPLGSTLTFTVAATDPDNDPVSFAATPLPLPAHATFNAQTGLLLFTPDATQVGSFPLTIIASDSILTVSETITVTVTGAPAGGVTGVSGRVVDGSGQPIASMPVSVKGTTATTTTDAQGQFTLNTLTVSGKQVLLANGFTQGYAILASPVDLIPNVMNTLPSELRVPVIDMASAVTVNQNATTVLGNPAFPAVSVTIPPHTAKNANGTDYTGVLTISPVPEYGRPESRPVELKPGFSITIQPAGITFTTPAPITLPNTDNLPVGNEFDLWSLSPDTGTFYVAGRMKVSADGSKLETLSGGVQKTAWHFALAPAASIPNEQNRILGGCTECAMASGADLTEGTLTQDVTIPGVRTLGQSRDLTLHYTSTTADVRPILPVTATLDIRAAVPSTFSANITVGGLQQGTRGYWNASPMSENATSTTRLGVQYDAAMLPTGRYPYELATFSNYAQSSIGAISRGFTMIRNEQQSAFGAGWTLRGVDRLIPTTGNTLLLAGGEGRTIPFVNTSVANFVSWWPAEGSAQDVRGGFNGTLQNGVTFAAGQVGQGFNLDGVNDVISVPHNVAHNPPALTIAAWVNITQAPATGQEYYVISKYDGNFNGYILRVGSTLVPTISLQRAPNVASHTTAATAIPLHTWVHLAATYDGTTASIYVNGVLQGSSVLTGGYSGATVPLALGAASWFNGGYTKGLMDGVELYAQAKSASQVHALFSGGGRKDLAADFSSPPSDYSILKNNPDGTYTRTLKDGTTYQFNIQGLQISMADRNGNTTTHAYNGSNQLTTVTDPAGQVTTLSYNGTRLATITDPAGRVTQLTHDSAGNLITVDAADQTQQRFAYDAQHRMTQRTDAQNKVYAYQFDHAGRLQRAILPGGAFREIRPTELTAVPNLATGQGTPDNPATITQPPIVQATYKDAKGQTTTFETDAIGRVTKQIDPLNRTTTIARDPQGNPLTITRPNGAVTTMTYDAKGNLLTSTEQAIAATTSFVYEPVFNQVTRITDPKGNQTNITYDVKGNPLTITDADNKVTRFFYNAQGLLTETRDALYPAHPATTFTYDALGRLLTTTDPLNRTTTLTYDTAGNVATSTDALSRITTFLYDQKNRLKQVTDPATGVTVYTYDGNGNLLTVKDAKNQTTTFAYDDRNRLLSTTDPLGKVEAYSYDGNDNLLTRVTPKNDTIAFAYDAVNQLTNKTLPGAQVTSYTYSTVGNLLTVADPDSALTMTYDPANRLLTTATTGSSNQPPVTLVYSYDRNGNRLSRLDPVQLSNYTYDGLNRLTTLTAPPGQASSTTGLLAAWLGEGTADDAVSGQHGTLQNGVVFAPGQLGQAFQFDGINDYASIPDSAVLDNLGAAASFEAWVKPDLQPALPQPTFRLLFARRNPNLSESFSVGLTDAGRLLVVVQGTSPSSSFWSPVGVVTSNQWQHIAVTVDLTAGTIQAYVNGLPVSLTIVNGPGTLTGTFANVTEGYLGRWQDPSVPASGVGPAYYKGLLDDVRLYHRALPATDVAAHAGQPSFITMAYDALSRRTAMTLPNGTQTTYSYDPASQVTNVLHQLTATSTTINQAGYLYNNVGNRTSLTDRRGAQAFGYDNLDRLTSASHPLLATPQAFAYDAVGNRTTGGSVVNAGNQLTADATHSYQYDDNGNLTRKTLLATGNYTQFTYDAENRLTKVEDFVAGNPTPAFTSTYRYDGLGRRIEKMANGQTKRYVYDGEDILLEYDGTNTLQARYTHGPGIDEPIAVTKAGNTFFYHQDGLGTVTELTDSAGAVAKAYAYDAYGNIVDQTGTVDQPYTYTGRELDSEMGLYYYRARYYDAATGRFLQKDPIGTEGGLNLYRYVENNPANWIDSIGLAPKDKTYGLPSDFWKWYHRQEKRPGDPDINQDQARDLYDKWKREGKPDPDGHRTEPENDRANGNTNYCPIPDPLPPFNMIPAPDDLLPDYVRPFLPKDSATPKTPRIPGRIPTPPFRFPIPAW